MILKKQKIALLKTLRDQLGLSKTEMAQALKLNASIYGKYERRDNFPSSRILKRIIDFYIDNDIAGDELYKNLLVDFFRE